MRNLTLSALPAATHNLAELEARYNLRRRNLAFIADCAVLAGRQLVQPSMAWTSGPRTQPRDGRGRFLSNAWLRNAETFTPSDIAWFRHAPQEYEALSEQWNNEIIIRARRNRS